jgi:hypothetical protein
MARYPSGLRTKRTKQDEALTFPHSRPVSISGSGSLLRPGAAAHYLARRVNRAPPAYLWHDVSASDALHPDIMAPTSILALAPFWFQWRQNVSPVLMNVLRHIMTPIATFGSGSLLVSVAVDCQPRTKPQAQ